MRRSTIAGELQVLQYLTALQALEGWRLLGATDLQALQLETALQALEIGRSEIATALQMSIVLQQMYRQQTVMLSVVHILKI